MALSLCLALPSAAQEFVEVAVTGSLSVEARAALADLIDPGVDYGGLVAAFQASIPAEEILGFEANIDPRFLSSQGPDEGPAIPELFGSNDLSAPLVRITDFSSLHPAFVPSSNGQEFVLIESDSAIAMAFDTAPQLPNLGGGSAVRTQLAVPIRATDLRVSVFLDSAQEFQLFNADVVSELASIESDVNDIGSSVRILQAPENLSAADRARIFAILSSANEIAITDTVNSTSVSQELPKGAVIQTAAGGACIEGLENWPFNADLVASVIRHDLKVLTAAGVTGLRRAGILVIDSGLPEDLAQHDDFRRFLRAGPDRTLRRDYFWKNKNGGSTCTGRAALGQSRFGFFPMIKGAGTCVAQEPFGALLPPAASEASPSYIPDHGGLVAVIAAGGPSLISSMPELDRMVGIRFARVMQKNGVRVVALPADISRAVNFAADDGFVVVNASLRATERGIETFTPAFGGFRGKGLIVAAAGNSGGELLAGSQTFPAAIADANGDNDGLIIVGGLHRPNPSMKKIEQWPQSSFSSRLVDIAAPSADILSLNGKAESACFSGTSVAAPQVSFAAGMLYSLGYAAPAEIRRRILATARLEPVVATGVRDGRILDLAVALDVYTDLIWRRGEKRPERVRILPLREDSDNPVVRLCDSGFSTLEAPDGWIDPARLHLWSRTGEDAAQIWHDNSNGITPTSNSCKIPKSRIRVVFAESGEQEVIDLANIDRIVPTRLRESLISAYSCCNSGPSHLDQ